jgi:hypothetical protein
MGQMKNAYRMLGRKPEHKTQVWECRRRWEDNIKMDVEEK